MGMECFGLGLRYQDGIGMKKNQPMALAYFALAAERGSKLGQKKQESLEGAMPHATGEDSICPKNIGHFTRPIWKKSNSRVM